LRGHPYGHRAHLLHFRGHGVEDTRSYPRPRASSAAHRDRIHLEQHARQGKRGHADQRLRGRPLTPDLPYDIDKDVELGGVVADDVRPDLDDVTVGRTGGGERGAEVRERLPDLLGEVAGRNVAVGPRGVLPGDEHQFPGGPGDVAVPESDRVVQGVRVDDGLRHIHAPFSMSGARLPRTPVMSAAARASPEATHRTPATATPSAVSPPSRAPKAMDRLKAATNSDEAGSVNSGAALSIQVCSVTDTPP